jgi:ATP-binding cassette subfamily E protein 1
MRIAVLIRERCQPKKCVYECQSYCPPVRTGTETVVMGEDGKPVISEELCVGCGICVHKCPFEAIKIISLPDEMRKEIIHQYGMNGFTLFGLPSPQESRVVGIIGANGIGKTTAVRILSGEIIPNLGDYEEESSWDDVIENFSGTELKDYFRRLADGKLKVSIKPQYVDNIPKVHKGEVKALLRKMDVNDILDGLVDSLDMGKSLGQKLSKLSGGELQRVAIAATLLKDADIYFFDEPSSYLDVKQRMEVAKVLQDVVKEKRIVVVEHDLAILDFLAEVTYLMYGSEGAYGIFSHPRSTRVAVNTYLTGYLKEENVRFRGYPIKFEVKSPKESWLSTPLVEYGDMSKRFKNFRLEVRGGRIKKGEVVGVLGPNATGKTTFVKVLAGQIKATTGDKEFDVKVSYKPQYIEPKFKGTVKELFEKELGKKLKDFIQADVIQPLNIRPLWENTLSTLSGGELQRVAIALCLAREADIYLIDEPSAYLDSNQRIETAKVIRRTIENRGKSAMIVEHDVYFIDIVADSIMAFSGEPSVNGLGEGPFSMRDGMNKFLGSVDITFRRDNDTNRPRINKFGSKLDREQKETGEYYYLSA